MSTVTFIVTNAPCNFLHTFQVTKKLQRDKDITENHQQLYILSN